MDDPRSSSDHRPTHLDHSTPCVKGEDLRKFIKAVLGTAVLAGVLSFASTGVIETPLSHTAKAFADETFDYGWKHDNGGTGTSVTHISMTRRTTGPLAGTDEYWCTSHPADFDIALHGYSISCHFWIRTSFCQGGTNFNESGWYLYAPGMYEYRPGALYIHASNGNKKCYNDDWGYINDNFARVATYPNASYIDGSLDTDTATKYGEVMFIDPSTGGSNWGGYIGMKITGLCTYAVKDANAGNRCIGAFPEPRQYT